MAQALTVIAIVALVGNALAQAVPMQMRSTNVPGSSMKALQAQPVPGSSTALNTPAGISDSQLQQICAQLSSPQVASQVEAIARSMGISSNQIAQACMRSPSGAPGAPPAPQETDGARPLLTPQTPPQPSTIEEQFRDLSSPFAMLKAPDTDNLRQFGYDLFTPGSSSFSPLVNLPVSDEYRIGPGDQLNLMLWGRMSENVALSVQPDGTLLIPEQGPLTVAGLNFGEARKLIEARFDQMEGVHAAVTMGQLRTIQVFAMGEVNQPGVYTVNGLSHVSDVLEAAGGVSKLGSLRNIEVERSGNVIARIDVYNMLLKGDRKSDIFLQQQDVVFIPVIGPVVAVAGDVKRPAIYEMKGAMTLPQVLKLAAGVSPFGYSRRVQVERIENHARRVELDISLNDPRGRHFAIQEGDLVKLLTVLPETRQTVKLQGDVKRPGTYQWYRGIRVVDLLREGQGLSPHAFLDYARLRRFLGPEHKMQMIAVDLGAALSDESGQRNVLLDADDELTVFSKSELGEVPTVSIAGAVRNPGTYPLTDGMRISDLVYEAGGPKESAYTEHAQLARSDLSNGAAAHYLKLDVDLRAALSSASDDLLLQPRDELLVQEAANWHPTWQVQLKGEVMRPGPYVINAGERLAQVLRECGGFRSDAYPPAAVFIRKSVKAAQQRMLDETRMRLQQEITELSMKPSTGGQTADNSGSLGTTLAIAQQVLAQSAGQQALGRVVISLEGSIDDLTQSPDNLVLQDGDVLYIPRQPGAVNVLGEVHNPTTVAFEPGLRVRDYLERAGGATEGGDIDQLYVIKASGAVITDNAPKADKFPFLRISSGGITNARLEPGDTVYVPEKLMFVNNTAMAAQMAQIITSGMITMAFVSVMGSNL